MTNEQTVEETLPPFVHGLLYCPGGWEGNGVPHEVAAKGINNDSRVSSWPVILVEMRFDGTFGFPGGFIDSSEDVKVALAREIKEEIGWDGLLAHPHVITEICSKSFYAIEISRDELKEIECGSSFARDHPSEVLGLIRLPDIGYWYEQLPGKFVGKSLKNMLEGHRFVATAKMELLRTIKQMNWLPDDLFMLVTSGLPSAEVAEVEKM